MFLYHYIYIPFLVFGSPNWFDFNATLKDTGRLWNCENTEENDVPNPFLKRQKTKAETKNK